MTKLRWCCLILVMATALGPAGAEAAGEWRRLCMLGSTAERDARIAVAPEAAVSTISTVLPDRGLVPFTIDRPWEDGLAYFALAGHAGDAPGLVATSVPKEAQEVAVLQPRASSDGSRTELRVRLPEVRGFAFWPRYRVLIIGCRPNAEPVEFVAALDVPIAARLTAIAGAVLLVACVLLSAAAVRRRLTPHLGFMRSLDPLVIAEDSLGYGSISRLQVLFFSMIVFGLLTYIALRTGIVGEISPDVLVLMGIAAAGSAGAALVGNVGPAAARDAGVGSAATSGERTGGGTAALTPETRDFLARTGLVPLDRVAQWHDLFIARGEIDIFRVQAVVFSLFVGGTLLASGIEQLAFYTIPPTVLGLLGLSQASYVGGKMVFRHPGDIAELNTVAAAAEAALAAVAGGDRSPQAIGHARAELGVLRRQLALLLEEAVPQARFDALIAAVRQEARPT